MRNTIHSLLNDDVRPAGKSRPDAPEYCEHVRRMLEAEDALRSQLGPKLEKVLDRYLEEKDAVSRMESEQLQTEAFSLALRMAAEAFTELENPLPCIG